MGKSILIGVPGQAQEIVEAAGGGIAFQPENAEDLARAVAELASNEKAARNRGLSGQAYVRTEFDRKAMAARYLDEISAVVDRAPISREGTVSMFRRLAREFEFARYIPARQIARRIQIIAKRTILDSIFSAPPLKPWQGDLPARLPLPGLTAPHGTLVREAGEWRATFLSQNRKFGAQQSTGLHAADDPRGQLWAMNLHYFEYLPDLETADAVELI